MPKKRVLPVVQSIRAECVHCQWVRELSFSKNTMHATRHLVMQHARRKGHDVVLTLTTRYQGLTR